jgi:putative transposon-encoded protein
MNLMKMKLFFALCLLLSFGAIAQTQAQGLVPPCPPCEPPTRISIHGTVANACGVPLSGVQVTITRGTFVRNVTTNSSGQYFAGLLVPGIYTVTPGKARYTFSPTSIVVPGDDGELSYTADFTSYLNHAPSDFNGDGITDVAVWRPSDGTWYVQSGSGYFGVPFGQSGDLPVPEDYDGDGATDYAVFRPSEGVWYILQSSNSEVRIETFGGGSNIPVPGNYDCDDKADLATFNPTTGAWTILRSSDGTTQNVAYGTSGDKPVQADYDGDGKVNIAVFRPSTGTWYILNNDGSWLVRNFGLSTDIPVPSDYTGDRRADIAVFRPSNGTWYVSQSDTSFFGVPWGLSGDKPTPGIYDGDLLSDFSVARPTSPQNVWYTLFSTSGTYRIDYFGLSGDIPVPSAYIPQLRTP